MRLAATMLLVGSIALAACSGDDAETSTTTPTTTATESTGSETPTTAPIGGEGRTAQDGDSVAVHYVGTLDDGSQFDSSRDRDEPLPFVVGSDQVIAGFDEAVRGMAVGDVVTVRIPPEDAYGERDDELEFSVPIEEYLKRYYIGHYSPLGNFFTAFAIKDKVVEMLDPKPTPYREA